MNQWQKTIVIALVICVGILPVSDLVAFASDTPSGPGRVKQRIDQLGVGANLKVQLADGKKVKGSVVSVGEDGFDLSAKSGDSPRHIAYNNVNEVKLAKLTYRAKGTPDPVLARRVVLGLGVGRHVQVKTTTGKEYHGNIQAADPDSFTMLPDQQTAPVQVAYSDVVQFGPNLTRGGKIALIVVGSLVAAYLIWFAGWGPR